MKNNKITIFAYIDASIEKTWEHYTKPEHIVNWNFAADTWHCPWAESDLRKGGRFSSRMEAKDGSFGFDFAGTFDEVKPLELIRYTLGDNRKVEVYFEQPYENKTKVLIIFEPELQNPPEMQQQGWQAILDNFRKYTEAFQDI